MVEFGSDFHRCDELFHGENTIYSIFPSSQFYASGRTALLAIALDNKWKRLWVPSYFCHEIINIWKRYIDICLYNDSPLENQDNDVVRSLPYIDGDALLRMNYFGLRVHRSNIGIPVPVVEDHSHALTSHWALHSDADWCIASLRKSLPVAYGGILWSPKGLNLPTQPSSNTSFNQMARERYQAMDLKTQYLVHHGGNKNLFRSMYIATEKGIDYLKDIIAIDPKSEMILKKLDILRWNEQKNKNWQLACLLLNKFNIIGKQSASSAFSIIVQMPNQEVREQFKAFLIRHAIFPAILWNIPEDIPYLSSIDFGNKMLSIHCDARYTEKEIEKMCNIINQYDTNH